MPTVTAGPRLSMKAGSSLTWPGISCRLHRVLGEGRLEQDQPCWGVQEWAAESVPFAPVQLYCVPILRLLWPLSY